MIYLDNAATSYPKPSTVVTAVENSFAFYGANPGRSGHQFSVKTAEKVFETRAALNSFFNGYGSEFVSFTKNCTEALNVAIKGLINEGDHVIISSLEHNSVVRPLEALKKEKNVSYTVVEVSSDLEKTLVEFKRAFKENTKLCVITAVSNVFGNILPFEALAKIAHSKGAVFVLDGAQGAGVINIDMKKQGIDCLCVPGHKGLLGPMGTGAVLYGDLNIKSLIEGGTGTESFNLNQPNQFPERLESGTVNVPGICGLYEGLKFLNKVGLEEIFEKESDIGKTIFDELKNIKNVKLYRENYDKNNFSPVISFNINGKHSEEVAMLLNEGGVAVRGGYHCAPLAHIHMGTKATGTVRISPSFNTTKKDINILLNLVEKIAIIGFI